MLSQIEDLCKYEDKTTSQEAWRLLAKFYSQDSDELIESIVIEMGK